MASAVGHWVLNLTPVTLGEWAYWQPMADFAVDALKDKGAPSDQCMLEGLRLWGFDKNKGGDNVVPTGQELVHSDTFGLHMTRGEKQTVMS